MTTCNTIAWPVTCHELAPSPTLTIVHNRNTLFVCQQEAECGGHHLPQTIILFCWGLSVLGQHYNLHNLSTLAMTSAWRISQKGQLQVTAPPPGYHLGVPRHSGVIVRAASVGSLAQQCHCSNRQ